jgi:hypothetical protein
MDLQNTAEQELFDLSCQMWRLMQRKKQLLAQAGYYGEFHALEAQHSSLWKQAQILFSLIPPGRRNRIGFMAAAMCS